jgi:hypothetical protein
MIQAVAIVILFGGAVFYLGRLLYRSFKPAKNGCAGACKCDSSPHLTPKL